MFAYFIFDLVSEGGREEGREGREGGREEREGGREGGREGIVDNKNINTRD